MEYIQVNQAFTAVFAIPESQSGHNVTYAIYKASDGSLFGSGNASFVAGINWKVIFTPTAYETYVVQIHNVTLDIKYTESFKAVSSVSMADVVMSTTTTPDTPEQMLAKVDLAISARLSGGAVQSYAIGGRNLEYITLKELRELRAEFQEIIAAKKGGVRNYVTFTNPK